jgi:hypothetical protein
MPSPDFSKQTIDTLAKRARFQCSNPDCGVQTIGPNSDQGKATLIGEAAHIYGARLDSARHDATMSDVTRAAITNAIWLCRNCHGIIDRDATQFPAELLLIWRRTHEEYVLRELGTRGERLRYEVALEQLDFLSSFPQRIQRIVIDKPEGWEWRFVADLMRHLNNSEFKRLRNLRDGHYFRPYARVKSSELLGWITERTHVMSKLIPPLAHLLDRLTKSFGLPGEPADSEEMFDVCKLIHIMLAEMVTHEEILQFTQIPAEAEELRAILADIVGSNTEGIAELPTKLDEMVALIGTDHGGTKENPRIVTWQVPFSVPNEANHKFELALDRYVSNFGV